jgi:YD repeat-containing protein
MKKSIKNLIVGFVGILSTSAAAQTTSTYSYDELGRLKTTSVTNTDLSAVTTYSYDAGDNRSSVQTTASTSNVIQVTSAGNLRTLANAAGYTGASAGSYQFVVAAGVTISGFTGSSAIDTGVWPAGSSVSLVVNGNVYGGGGQGGNGSTTGSGSAGGNGGDAVYVQAPITITIGPGGAIKGGGGGGGGGSGTYPCGGGGGGGGFPNGAGGIGATNSSYHCGTASGSTGTLSGGGAGGTGSGPSGGTGGAAASAGTAGSAGMSPGGGAGQPGYAIRKNGVSVICPTSGLAGNCG